MKRLFFLVIFASLLAALILFGLSDAAISGESIPDDEITTSQTEASNSSASGTITITWTTAPLSDE